MLQSRARFTWFFAAVGLGAAVACSDGSGGQGDAGGDVVYGHHSLDAAVYDAGPGEKTPDDRLAPHQGDVLAAPHVRAIYVGAAGVDQSKTFDPYLTWMLGSTAYWSILAQYGVGYGTFDGRTEIATDAFFQPGMVNGGFVDWYVLEKRLRAVIHPDAPDAGAPDAGDDATAGDAGDAGDDGGDAATVPPIPLIPPADAYVVFLPDGVNVDLGNGTTCADAGGYHSFDGVEPYAIIPPCGRYDLVVSHEMAEMATDPIPGTGWYSDADQANGGEVGDLCNYATTVDGHTASQLWSNEDGDCEPP